jgi:hypothetical protein
MPTDSERIAELEKYAHQMANHYWRFQGRINAMELVATLATINFAKTQPDPFQFIQDYVESMRQTSSSLLPEVDDPNNADRLVSETKNAVDDFLAQLIQVSGQLKGGPGNR